MEIGLKKKIHAAAYNGAHTVDGKTEFDFFQLLNHVDVNLKPRFLINRGYYIVPSLSTALHFIKQFQRNM